MSRGLRVFISSSMDELKADRATVRAALAQAECEPWSFENDAGARTTSIQKTYLDEVANADLYIGLFYRKLGVATAEEFEFARSLGKPLLIFERRDDAGPRSSELESFLANLNDLTRGVTVQRYRDPEGELGDLVKASIEHVSSEFFRGASAVIALPEEGRAAQNDELNALTKLWNGVNRRVMDGLDSPLADLRGLEPTLLHSPGLVRPPAGEQEPDRPERQARVGELVSAIFEAAAHTLLIAGPAGSGKTVALLELARQVMPSRGQLPTSRLPVILPLSTWSRRERRFQAWAAATIAKEYYSSRKLVEGWIERGRLILFLDGLDQVRVEEHAACIEAINGFVMESGTSIAVGCRLDDYAAANVKLIVGDALTVQSLEAARVDAFLEGKGPGLAFLRAGIQGDPLWRELAQSPLMLSVMIQTYDGLTAEELASERHTTRESRQRYLWDRYVETRIARKPRKHPETGEQIRSGLRWLAKRMKTHGKSTFFLDQLQPSWLGGPLHRCGYGVLTRAAAAATVAVAFWALVAVSSAFSAAYRWQIRTLSGADALMGGLAIVSAGLLWGLVKGGRFASARWGTKPANVKRRGAALYGLKMLALALAMYHLSRSGVWVWLGASAAFVWGGLLYPVWRRLRDLNHSTTVKRWRRHTLRMLGGIAYGAVGGIANALADPPAERFEHVAAGVVVGAFLGLITYRRSAPRDDIRPFEAARWSWLRALTWAAASVLFMIVLVLLLMFGESPRAFQLGMWRTGVEYGFGFGLAFALAGFVLGGWTRDHRTRKVRPNEGILITRKSAAVGAVTGAVVGVALMILWQGVLTRGLDRPGLEESLRLAPGSAICAALLVALGKGGAQLQRHYLLRWLLSREREAPQPLPRFLELAASLNLLRWSGGSYAFLHDVHRDHCAEDGASRRAGP